MVFVESLLLRRSCGDVERHVNRWDTELTRIAKQSEARYIGPIRNIGYGGSDSPLRVGPQARPAA